MINAQGKEPWEVAEKYKEPVIYGGHTVKVAMEVSVTMYACAAIQDA